VSRPARAVAAALAASGALVAASSGAQGAGDVPLRPADRAYVAGHGIFSASPHDSEVSTAHVAPQLSAGVRLRSWLTATVDVTAASTTFRVAGEERRSSFRLGNPLLTFQAALLERPEQRLRVGLGVAPPLATFPGTIPANTRAEYNYAVATAARGFGDHWLWAPNAIPIVLLLHSRAELPAPLFVGAELEPAVLVSVNANPSRVAVIAAAHAGYRLGAVTPGARLQLFAQSTPLAARNFTQWAAAVYLDTELGAAFLRSQILANLDAPFGVAGQRGATVWGGALGGGVRF
jgi:hypothetical protein